MQAVNSLSMQVFANLFSSVAEEMGIVLQRASFSPNIKMRRDFSCAVFDSAGNLLAQAAHMPVHLGAMPLAMQEVRSTFELRPGDVAILNDPYAGGTHLPDVSLASGAFSVDGRRLGYVMCRAHHADIGGISPGSMPLSSDIFQEGVIIPPLLLVEQGRVNESLLSLILRNVRTPEERRGDFAAQLAAQHVGEERMIELGERYGADTLEVHGRALQDYAERMTRAVIGRIPSGRYSFADHLDDDGATDRPVTIAVTIRRDGASNLLVDFSGSDEQRNGPVNTVLAVTTAATLYVIRCLQGEDVPVNQGTLRPIDIRVPAGSVVSAQPPAAVAAGNVETSQRIVDVLFGALATALPQECPAASAGTMNNLAIGGIDPRNGKPFAYYETMGGGAGGRPWHAGMSGVHDHMSNTLNTPVEALEAAYPVLIVRYALREHSGGAGAYPGGAGLQRDLRFLAPCQVTVLSDRRVFPPYGVQGGSPGAPGESILLRGGIQQPLASKAAFFVEPGDVLSLRSPGGGGYGGLPDSPGHC